MSDNSQDTVIKLTAIGKISTNADALSECVASSRLNRDESLIEVRPELEEALTNIQLATHLIVLYWFEQADRTALMRTVRPGESLRRGVFASRSPNRPNPVALSIVRLLERDGNRLRVSGLDCLDGTLLLDLKPYVPSDDRIDDARIGWEGGCVSTCLCNEEVEQ